LTGKCNGPERLRQTNLIAGSCYEPKQLLACQGPAGRAAIGITGEGGCLLLGPRAGTFREVHYKYTRSQIANTGQGGLDKHTNNLIARSCCVQKQLLASQGQAGRAGIAEEGGCLLQGLWVGMGRNLYWRDNMGHGGPLHVHKVTI
jgi:hypothetical protein